jgi:hypothetical protein
MTDHESTGGQGDGPPLSRSDMADVRRACRQDWPISASVQIQTIQRMADLIDPDFIHADGRKPSARTRIAAARTLGALGSLSLRQQALDLERDRLDGPAASGKTLVDLVAEAEAIAEEFDRERGSGATPGPAAGPVP